MVCSYSSLALIFYTFVQYVFVSSSIFLLLHLLYFFLPSGLQSWTWMRQNEQRNCANVIVQTFIASIVRSERSFLSFARFESNRLIANTEKPLFDIRCRLDGEALHDFFVCTVYRLPRSRCAHSEFHCAHKWWRVYQLLFVVAFHRFSFSTLFCFDSNLKQRKM